MRQMNISIRRDAAAHLHKHIVVLSPLHHYTLQHPSTVMVVQFPGVAHVVQCWHSSRSKWCRTAAVPAVQALTIEPLRHLCLRRRSDAVPHWYGKQVVNTAAMAYAVVRRRLSRAGAIPSTSAGTFCRRTAARAARAPATRQPTTVRRLQSCHRGRHGDARTTLALPSMPPLRLALAHVLGCSW